jgi:hypothetical protein
MCRNIVIYFVSPHVVYNILYYNINLCAKWAHNKSNIDYGSKI